MGRATPPPSFNTLKRSNRPQRIKRLRQERLTLLAICTVVILILLFLAAFLIGSIAQAIIENNSTKVETPSTPGGDTSGETPAVIYTQMTQANSAVYTGELLLVNADHEYKFPTSAAESLVNIYDKRAKVNGSNIYQLVDNTMKLNSKAFTAFEDMVQKYYAVSEDTSTLISSAYRTAADQEKLGSTVKAGYSDHHTGYCVALQQYNVDTGTRTSLDSSHWIYQNCYKYGFIIRYPASKSSITGVSGYEHCFRYVGVAHATYMYQNDLCLEEYVALLQDTYVGDNHLKITGADGNHYEVYYVPAGDSELTTISVPQNYQYTVSGDNVGGFIITVNLDAPNA